MQSVTRGPIMHQPRTSHQATTRTRGSQMANHLPNRKYVATLSRDPASQSHCHSFHTFEGLDETLRHAISTETNPGSYWALLGMTHGGRLWRGPVALR